MLRAARGTRSTREFALQSGVSESYISKALTGCLEVPPSKRTLLKLLRNEEKYHYLHSLQGDIVGIIDSNGTKVV